MRFLDKVAIVTGAGDGIGRATATLMASEGAHVIAVDLDVTALDSLDREMEAADKSVTVVEADVLDPEQVQRLVHRAIESHNQIDILVNAVGGATIIPHYDGDLDELSVDDWDNTIRFNLRGTFLCIRSVVDHMKERRSGTIVNVSSRAGHGISGGGNSAYVTAKAGIMALTKKLSKELGPYGITCNAIAPGLTLTGRTTPGWLSNSESEKRQIMESIPLRRLAEPVDQASVIAFLASEDAGYVNGVTIDVNGGQYGSVQGVRADF